MVAEERLLLDNPYYNVFGRTKSVTLMVYFACRAPRRFPASGPPALIRSAGLKIPLPATEVVI